MESWFLLSQVSKAIVCGGTHFTFPGLGPSAWGRVRETQVLRLRRAAPDPLRMAEVGLGSRSPTQARLGRARRACAGEDARTTAGKDAGAPIGAGTPGSGSVRIEKSNRRSRAYRASRYFALDDSAEGGFVPSPPEQSLDGAPGGLVIGYPRSPSASDRGRPQSESISTIMTVPQAKPDK